MNPYTAIIPSCTLSNVIECTASIARTHPGAGPDFLGVDVAVVVNGELLKEQNVFPWDIGRIEDQRTPFNFSAAINRAVSIIESQGERPDILILNDDTRLLTMGGFDALRDAAYAHPECGLMFPSVTGCTGNPEHITQPGGGVRYAKRHVVPFIGVYILREVWDQVGPLDEDYCLDYGVEDNDYCYRVTQAGYNLGIFDGCVLEHGVLPSSYRDGAGPKSFTQNAALFQKKHGVSIFDLP